MAMMDTTMAAGLMCVKFLNIAAQVWGNRYIYVDGCENMIHIG